MNKKQMKYTLIVSIGNIINGILGLSRTKKGFSVFMIIVGFLCLAVEFVTAKNEKKKKMQKERRRIARMCKLEEE